MINGVILGWYSIQFSCYRLFVFTHQVEAHDRQITFDNFRKLYKVMHFILLSENLLEDKPEFITIRRPAFKYANSKFAFWQASMWPIRVKGQTFMILPTSYFVRRPSNWPTFVKKLWPLTFDPYRSYWGLPKCKFGICIFKCRSPNTIRFMEKIENTFKFCLLIWWFWCFWPISLESD